MPFDHSECDHPRTKEGRSECREKRNAPRRGPPSEKPAQLRSRARRHQKKMEAELTKLYKKPVEEWDMEELAHGKPRDRLGSFSGVPPKWVTRQVHEEAVRRFKQMLNSKVRIISAPAIDVLLNLMADNQFVYDDEGQAVRYLVPPSVKAQIGQYLIDHVIGKPTQPVESKGEIMHHIQSILAGSLVNPEEVVEAEPVDDEEQDDDADFEHDDKDLHSLVVKRSREE